MTGATKFSIQISSTDHIWVGVMMHEAK